MKRTFLLVALMLLGLAILATRGEASELFPSKDSSLRVFGTYLDQADKQWGGGLGLDYFFSSYVGMGLSSHVEDIEGTAVDNLASELYLRMPIEKWKLAPYAVGAVGYEFGSQKWFQAVGGGVELRFSKKFGIFADYQYVFHEDYDDNVIRAGIRVR